MMKQRKKRATTVYFTPEQAEKLAELSEKTRVPQAEHVRQALDAYFASR